MRVLGDAAPRPLADDELRVRVQATFGLINSTPHTARIGRHAASTPATVRPVLERMAWAGLNAPEPDRIAPARATGRVTRMGYSPKDCDNGPTKE